MGKSSLLNFVLLVALHVSTASGQVLRMEKIEEPGTFAFASYYQSNMVLQMEPTRATIWGYGTIGATVNISVNVQDVYSTKVQPGFDKRGIWSVVIKPQPAYTKTDIQGVHDDFGMLQWILIRDVMFGDVWVCSGQSNMQFTMSMVFNATKEIEESVNYPNIRLFTVAEETSTTPLYDLKSIQQSWSIPSKATVGNGTWTYFSAVCWLYGRYLYDELKIPIGLIATTWGGTPVEAWSSPWVFKHCGLSTSPPGRYAGPGDNSVLWNAMIHPLLNLTIKGAIWYQGEANTAYHRDSYQCMFPAMISSWRKEWFQGSRAYNDPDFPFGFVQISTKVEGVSGYPVIRWHQTADHGYVPNPDMVNTFMAVAMDLRDDDSPYGSVHPRNKQDVARRLVAGALSVVYHRSIVFDGPFPESVTEGDAHVVTIRYSIYQQLEVTDEGNFEICCESNACNDTDTEESAEWVVAHIISHIDHEILLSGEKCNDNFEYVKKVRYAWKVNPCEYKKCSVYNTLGFPGAPFVLDVTREK